MKKNDLLKSMELISQFNNREACRQIHDILSDILSKCRREDIESRENKSFSVERDASYIRGTVQGPSHKDEFKKAGEVTCETVTLTLSDADLIIFSAYFPHDITDTREDPSYFKSAISSLPAYPSDKLDETVILETKNIVDVGFEQHNDEEKPKESEKINVPLDINVGDLEDTVIIGKTQGDKKDTNVSEIMKAELCEDEAGKFHWKEKDLEKTLIITPIKN